MDYELCKKLKDAGFPQKFDVGKTFFSDTNATFGNVNNLTDGSDKINIPRLSELIEACGDGFEWLGLYKAEPYGYKDDEFFNKDKWVCGKWEDPGCSEGSYFIEETFGSTPEEAVANLWLELNKK